jgi:hypothetical protein
VLVRRVCERRQEERQEAKREAEREATTTTTTTTTIGGQPRRMHPRKYMVYSVWDGIGAWVGTS